MGLLILDTSKYDDPLSDTWHASPRYTTSFLRRRGFDATVTFAPVLRADVEWRAPAPLALYFEVSEDNVSPSLDFLAAWRRSLPDTRFLVGGTTGGQLAEALLRRHSEIDGVVIGESEQTLADVMARLRARRPITDIPGLRVRDAGFQARTQITDLDELGMMAFDGLEQLFAQSPPAHRVAFLLGGRGCYANCGFCSVPAFTRQSSSARPWRGRSVALVVDEMELIAKSFGVRRFVFQDENFFGPGQAGRERARRLAAEILRRGLEIEYFVACRVNDVDAETLRAMKLSGLTRVGLGVESMNQASLSLFRKGYRAEAIRPALKVIGEIGIACEVNLIFFEPLMNVADVRRNLDFLEFVRKERWLTYSDGLPFKTLFVAPWLPIAGTLAAQGALEQDGTTCRFRDSRVAALAEFANRLQACMPVVFKQRGIIMRKEGLCAAEGTAGTVREIASYTERLREWLGLVVLPRYLRAACSAVEQRPADAVPRLAELATAFDGEMAALRHLGERLEEIVAERTGGQR